MLLLDMQSERSHLYLLPVGNTRGVTLEINQPDSYVVIVTYTAWNAGWSSTHLVFRTRTWCGQGALEEGFPSRHWGSASHISKTEQSPVSTPGPRLTQCAQPVFLDSLLLWQNSLSGLCTWNYDLNMGETVISFLTENQVNKWNKPSLNSRIIINYLVYKNTCPK